MQTKTLSTFFNCTNDHHGGFSSKAPTSEKIFLGLALVNAVAHTQIQDFFPAWHHINIKLFHGSLPHWCQEVSLDPWYITNKDERKWTVRVLVHCKNKWKELVVQEIIMLSRCDTATPQID